MLRTKRELQDRDLVLATLDKVVRYQLGDKWTLKKHMKLKGNLLNKIDRDI